MRRLRRQPQRRESGDPEVCDAADVDEDCDGLADDADASATGQTTWHPDADGDTYGSSSSSISRCDAPPAHVSDGTDCDDADPLVNPGRAEVCDPDDTDEDCDGLADDADASATGQTAWYLTRTWTPSAATRAAPSWPATNLRGALPMRPTATTAVPM